MNSHLIKIGYRVAFYLHALKSGSAGKHFKGVLGQASATNLTAKQHRGSHSGAFCILAAGSPGPSTGVKAAAAESHGTNTIQPHKRD